MNSRGQSLDYVNKNCLMNLKYEQAFKKYIDKILNINIELIVILTRVLILVFKASFTMIILPLYKMVSNRNIKILTKYLL